MSKPDYQAIRELEAEIFGQPVCECPRMPVMDPRLREGMGGSTLTSGLSIHVGNNPDGQRIEKRVDEPYKYVWHQEGCTNYRPTPRHPADRRGQLRRAAIVAAFPLGLAIFYLAGVGISAAAAHPNPWQGGLIAIPLAPLVAAMLYMAWDMIADAIHWIRRG
ncbi:hypothetical protein [Streptomyces sp. NPDC055085]